MTPKLAIFTICSNNYLPFARAFFASVQAQHPEADLFLCLADRAACAAEEPVPSWTILAANELGILDLDSLAFRYDIREFNTALKPFMLLYLLEQRGYDTVLYFDPDIYVYQRLDVPLAALRNGASMVLTPHILQPLETAEAPDDITIMRTGIYNLGFLGVSRTAESLDVLRWWGRRVREKCIDSQEEGLFVDQKFMDLAPAFAPACQILHHPGLNVAYWNLDQRDVTQSAGTWRAGEDDLIFFHFSGFDPLHPGRLSKYTTRFRNNLVPAMRCLTTAYADQLMRYGFGDARHARYAYATFASGAPIHALVRRMFRDWTPDWAGNPFQTYEGFTHEPWHDSQDLPPGLLVTNFMAYLWDTVPGLKAKFDLRVPVDARGFVAWYVLRAADTLALDETMVAPVRRHLAAHGIPLDNEPPPANVVDVPVSDNDRLLLEGLRTLRRRFAPVGSLREDVLLALHRAMLAAIAKRSTAKRAADTARRRNAAQAGEGTHDAGRVLVRAPASTH